MLWAFGELLSSMHGRSLVCRFGADTSARFVKKASWETSPMPPWPPTWTYVTWSFSFRHTATFYSLPCFPRQNKSTKRYCSFIDHALINYQWRLFAVLQVFILCLYCVDIVYFLLLLFRDCMSLHSYALFYVTNRAWWLEDINKMYLVTWIEWWCQNFNRKFISGRSCACAVKIWLKIALSAVKLPKFEPVIVVAEKDHGKRFTATFRAGVILRMRRELRGL